MELPLTDYDLHPSVKQRIEQAIESAKGSLLNADPTNAADVAEAQATVKTLMLVLGIPAIIQKEAENERRKNQL